MAKTRPDSSTYLTPEQLERLLQEIRWGLLLDEPPEEIDIFTDLPVFERIHEILMEEQARAICYFCNQALDANEIQIDDSSIFCLDCQFKLANFMTDLRLDPASVFPMTRGPRTVQSRRIQARTIRPDAGPGPSGQATGPAITEASGRRL